MYIGFDLSSFIFESIVHRHQNVYADPPPNCKLPAPELRPIPLPPSEKGHEEVLRHKISWTTIRLSLVDHDEGGSVAH